jgi:PAS domain-containing protein
MRTGAPQRWEARFTSTAGKTLWLHFRTELADLAGERGLLLVLGNITERTREEAERKQLIDGMNDTAIVLSFEGEFLEVNDRAIETLG